jgi:hypothetical protein
MVPSFFKVFLSAFGESLGKKIRRRISLKKMSGCCIAGVLIEYSATSQMSLLLRQLFFPFFFLYHAP